MTENLLKYLNSTKEARKQVMEKAKSYVDMTAHIRTRSEIDSRLQRRISLAFTEIKEKLSNEKTSHLPSPFKNFAFNGTSIGICSNQRFHTRKISQNFPFEKPNASPKNRIGGTKRFVYHARLPNSLHKI